MDELPGDSESIRLGVQQHEHAIRNVASHPFLGIPQITFAVHIPGNNVNYLTINVSTVPDDVNRSPQLDVYFEGMHVWGCIFDQGPNAFREKNMFIERAMLGGNLNLQVQEKEAADKAIRDGYKNDPQMP